MYSAETAISADYFTGDILKVGNFTYILIGTEPKGGYWNNYSAVIFKDNDTSSLFKVYKGKCYSTEYYDYCYNDSYYNWNKKFTYEGSVLEPSMKLRVYYNSPKVTVTQQTSLELEYSRTYSRTIEFKNTGSKNTIVYYNEQLPKEFSVQNCNGCDILNNKVTSQVRLQVGESGTIRYSIKYDGYSNFSWNSTYDYTYDEKNAHGTTKISSKVKTPYSIRESISKSKSTNLEDLSTFYFNVTNKESYSSLNLDLQIINDAVKSYSELENSGNIYYYKGIIPAGESKAFSITMSSELVGVFPIYLNAKMESHGQQFLYNKNYTFNVSLNPITPSIIVDKTVANPNDTITMLVSLKNTDLKQQYVYLYAHLLPQDEQWTYERLLPGEQLILYNDTFPVPLGNDDLHIVVSGVYRTTNLQDQTFKAEKTIDIIGRESPKINTSTANGLNGSNKTSIVNINNTSKNSSVKNSPEKNSNAPQTGNDDTEEPEKKKDLLTSILDSIDGFFTKLFG